MDVQFSVGDLAAVFVWSSITGLAEIVMDDERVRLQSPTKLSTHFGVHRQRSWRRRIRGHEVEVIKERPWLFAGLRPHTFTVLVDGDIVASVTGR